MLRSRQISGAIYAYVVSRVEKNFCKEIKVLLGTVHNLDLPCGCRYTEPGAVPVSNKLPQGEVTIRCGILKCTNRIFFHDPACCFHYPFGIYQGR